MSGIASGALNSSRQFGAGSGIALLGSLVASGWAGEHGALLTATVVLLLALGGAMAGITSAGGGRRS